MSFLNPVNEPVLRFKSTDADAPQINYAARTAGDVKAVLKACLVTGYGAKASAGWSIVNEVDHVAEFVSPSAAMSDYRLGIDDTSAANTTWYYQYQDVRTDTGLGTIDKNHSNIDKTSGKNGWELLATKQGLFFIEILDNSVINDLVARVVYFGRVKSGAISDDGANISFLNVGYSSTSADDFFRLPEKYYYKVGDYSADFEFSATNLANAQRVGDVVTPLVAIEVASSLYLYNGGFFVAEQPAILLADNNSATERYGVYDVLYQSRPALKVCLAYSSATEDAYQKYTRTILIYLDYWEY